MNFDCSHSFIENPFESSLIAYQTLDTAADSCYKIHRFKKLELTLNITADVNTNGTTTFCYNQVGLQNCANLLKNGCVNGFMVGYVSLSMQYYGFKNDIPSKENCKEQIRTIWDKENVWKMHYNWCRIH